MEQINMFTEKSLFPNNYEDLRTLYEKYIYEGEKDDDVFTWRDIKEDSARSYFFYGTKVLEFYPLVRKPYIKVIDRYDSKKSIRIPFDSPNSLIEETLKELKDRKRYIFRNLIEETFGCCNDFKKCSAVDRCIHEDDRFYNGCIYRTNLEAGRNFYKDAENTESKDVFTNIIGLDFETANASRTSACAVAAIKFDMSGNEIDSFYTLINPEEPFDGFNIMIHGITPKMVENSPTISKAMSRVFQMIDDDSIVVCHNAAFDMSVLRNSLMKEPLQIPDFRFTCTYRLASRVLPKNISYSLPDVAEECGITDLIHHDALSDASTCAKILFHLIHMFDDNITKLHITANINYGQFQNGEYDGIHRSIKESTTGSRKKSISYAHTYDVNPESPFYQKRVAFTGKLESMTRSEAIVIINDIGGFGSETFTKDTDFLITGYQDPRKLAGKEKSSKRIAAEKMLASGRNIEIITEEDFIKML